MKHAVVLLRGGRKGLFRQGIYPRPWSYICSTATTVASRAACVHECTPSYLDFGPRQPLRDLSEPDKVNIFPVHRQPFRVYLEDLPDKKQTNQATRHGTVYEPAGVYIGTWCSIAVVPRTHGTYENVLAPRNIFVFIGGNGGEGIKQSATFEEVSTRNRK